MGCTQSSASKFTAAAQNAAAAGDGCCHIASADTTNGRHKSKSPVATGGVATSAAAGGEVNDGDDDADLLTSDERTLLKVDWERLRAVDHQDMGVRIFLRIFVLEPSTGDAFPEFGRLHGDELRRNALFRCHAARFMRAVGAALSNIDALDLVVIPNLIQLGRIHRSVSDLNQRHLDAFEQAMAEVWDAELAAGDGDYRCRSAPVWNKVFRLITTKVYEGYRMVSETSSVTGVKVDATRTPPEANNHVDNAES